MKKLEELEAAGMRRWNWAAIFRPTKTRAILAVIFYPVLLLLLFNSIVQIDYVSKNRLWVIIGYIVNVVPVLFIWLVVILNLNIAIPFPVDFFLVVIAYYFVPGLWAYFLSCITIYLLSTLKRAQSEQ